VAVAAGVAYNRLLELKFQEAMLAEELGISWQQLKQAMKQLDEHLEKTLKTVTVERLELICPECLQPSAQIDAETGEKVCVKCGAVIESNYEHDLSLPFDTTYALESYLATDKSLGGTLNGKSLMRVLAMSANGSEDLGIRARHIRTIIQLSEPPDLDKALKHAYNQSRSQNMDHDKLFNQDLGRNVRMAYNICNIIHYKTTPKTLADTCFYLTLQQYGKTTLAQQILHQLNVDAKLMQYVTRTLTFITSLAQTGEE